MKSIVIANMGPVTYALKTSLELLGMNPLVPPPNNVASYNHSQEYISTELCYPLKIILGNYLFFKDQKPDAVIFFSGDDMCNLSPSKYSYMKIFKEIGWQPDYYSLDINSKTRFLSNYFNILLKLSGKPVHKVLQSIYLGFKKYELLNFIDQVFYNVRPFFDNSSESESLYNKYLAEIHRSRLNSEMNIAENKLLELYNNMYHRDNYFLKIGLIGDAYSLIEPYAHHHTDLYMGHNSVIADRWSNHRLIIPNIPAKKEIKLAVSNIFRHKYGVFTKLECVKITNYISRGYDALVFISPLSCNPSEIMRGQLEKLQEEFNIPILTLIFDEHTGKLGTQLRLEAFVEMLHKRKRMNAINTREYQFV